MNHSGLRKLLFVVKITDILVMLRFEIVGCRSISNVEDFIVVASLLECIKIVNQWTSKS